MRHRRPLLIGLAALVMLPLLVLGAALLAANTESGRRAIERAVARFSDGQVVVEGLAGRFPQALRIARLTLHDARGPWTSAVDVALDWSPRALVRRTFAIDRLHAAAVTVHRRPVAAEPSVREPEPAREDLPGRIVVERLDIDRVVLEPPVAGVPATLSVVAALDAASLSRFDVDADVHRLDAPGRYRAHARAAPERLAAEISVEELAQGLAARLAGLPDLGALSMAAHVEGPREAQRVRATLSAGPARADVEGTVDLVERRLTLAIKADAPAMRPAPEVAWSAASLDAEVRGTFDRPDATGRLTVREVSAGGASIRALEANVAGAGGTVRLDATIDGLHVPGPRPALFAAAPVHVAARATLDDATRPVAFDIAHPLLAATGTARTAAPASLEATLKLPSLEPLAAAAGVDAKGSADIRARVEALPSGTVIDADATLAMTGGQEPLVALLGNDARVHVAATLHDGAIEVQEATLRGRALTLAADGSRRGDAYDFNWRATLADLGAVAAQLRGSLTADGRARGDGRTLALDATARGRLGAQDIAPGPVTLRAQVHGPVESLSAAVQAQGTLAGAPLALSLQGRQQPDRTLRVDIERAAWKSAQADGSVTLPRGGDIAGGRIAFRIDRLEDLSPFVAQPLAGRASGSVALAPQGSDAQARIEVDGRDLRAAGGAVQRLTVSGTVDRLPSRPAANLQLAGSGVAIAGVTGDLKATVQGPRDALAVGITATTAALAGRDARLEGRAKVNAAAQTARIEQLSMRHGELAARLLQPVQVRYRSGVAMDRVRIGAGDAVLEVSGRAAPELDLQASLRNVSPDLARQYLPGLDARGRLGAEARLRGPPAAPRGTVSVNVDGFRMRSGPAQALPPASLRATAALQGDAAEITARADAGRALAATLDGRVPFAANGAMDVRVDGRLDLALANPVLEAAGRRVAGQATIAATVAGTRAAPRTSGTITFANGELQDYALGARLTQVATLLRLDGDRVLIERFDARAGGGTVSANGTIGVLQPQVPVDVSIRAEDATPLVSDLLTATLDADLQVRGDALQRLSLGGRIHVDRAEITVPDALPPDVAVLDVRRAGQPDGARAARDASVRRPEPDAVVALDLTVDAPRAVFVRGRGLDAELGGEVRVRGTLAEPDVSGGFALRRGTFDLAGVSLKFTRGNLGFAGTGVRGALDPVLDFLAETSAGSVTARLAVTGSARQPKFALSSTPELPQDEVLARLLYGVSIKDLSPFQVAQVAAGIAAIAGVGGGGPGALAKVQRELGLDRLTVGGGEGGTGPSVEAGRYVSDRVYVGARQSTSGTTQGRVQVDLTDHLKLQTTLGAGGGTVQGATPENDPGSSIGLSYQIEY